MPLNLPHEGSNFPNSKTWPTNCRKYTLASSQMERSRCNGSGTYHGAMLAGAAVFWLWLPLDQFLKVVQPMIVALSIMAAGLLVRLNHGMPVLDWKSLNVVDRKVLTQKIVELTREYMVVLLVQATTLTALLVLAVKNSQLPTAWQEPMLAIAGGLLALSVARTSYIVRRDHDIVRLQKKLIDDAADRETLENAQKEALSNVTAIRASVFARPPSRKHRLGPRNRLGDAAASLFE